MALAMLERLVKPLQAMGMFTEKPMLELHPIWSPLM